MNKTIAKIVENAKLRERERIIKLLEELKGPEKAHCDDCQPHADKNRHYLTGLIDLNKGENK